jgi:hypothetical protein
VQSNPVNALDPDGQRSRISVNEETCTITISLNIGIYGAKASDALARVVKQSIESLWNGHTTRKGCQKTDLGNCTVAVVANVKYYKDAKHWYHVPEDNQIKFTGKTKRSWTALSRSYGHWVHTGYWRYAHEAGHLMGLGDDYNYLSDRPNEGHEGHIMGDQGGLVVAQHEIDSAVKGNKCPKACCCPGKAP